MGIVSNVLFDCLERVIRIDKNEVVRLVSCEQLRL